MARLAVAHVFVDDVVRPRLSPDDEHHLTRVLRVRPGETVSVADGSGGWSAAAFGRSGGLEAQGDPAWMAAPAPPVTIALAIVKGDRPEWAVQKLTELGVDRIIPLVTIRGVVRWDRLRIERNLLRWRTVARQAAMQSRLLRLPAVDWPASPADLAARTDLSVALAAPGGARPALGRAILVGPEGGWAPEELAAGGVTVELGPTVLRTETAAVVAGTLLTALRAGVVRPGDGAQDFAPPLAPTGGHEE